MRKHIRFVTTLLETSETVSHTEADCMSPTLSRTPGCSTSWDALISVMSPIKALSATWSDLRIRKSFSLTPRWQLPKHHALKITAEWVVGWYVRLAARACWI